MLIAAAEIIFLLIDVFPFSLLNLFTTNFSPTSLQVLFSSLRILYSLCEELSRSHLFWLLCSCSDSPTTPTETSHVRIAHAHKFV